MMPSDLKSNVEQGKDYFFFGGVIIMRLLIMFLLFAPLAHAEKINIPALADAIFLAEGGAKASVPYGIMFKGCSKSTPEYCRKICLNTITKRYQKWLECGKECNSEGFIEYLSRSYAPIGAANDPKGLNRHWSKNTKFFYEMGQK